MCSQVNFYWPIKLHDLPVFLYGLCFYFVFNVLVFASVWQGRQARVRWEGRGRGVILIHKGWLVSSSQFPGLHMGTTYSSVCEIKTFILCLGNLKGEPYL